MKAGKAVREGGIAREKSTTKGGKGKPGGPAPRRQNKSPRPRCYVPYGNGGENEKNSYSKQ